jgi:small-conductance mechanosensitive channel
MKIESSSRITFQKFPGVLFLQVFICLLSGNLFGQALFPQGSQETAAIQVTTQADVDSLAQRPFALVAITRELGATERLLNESMAVDLSDEDLEKVARDVDSLFARVDLFLEESDLSSIETMSIRELEQVDLQDDFYVDQIEEMMKRLSAMDQELENQMLQLQVNRQRWRLTLEQGEADATLEARLERIESTMQRIDEVRRALQDDLLVVLETQDSLNAKKSELEALHFKVNELEAALGETIFQKDVPGFFSDLGNLGDRSLMASHWEEFKGSIRTDLDLLKSGYRRNMITSFLFFIALLVFMVWFKRNHSSRIAEDRYELSQQHLVFINSPVVSSLFFITLMIRLRIPELPLSFFTLNVLLMMIPMAFLMVRVYGRILRVWITVLVLITTLGLFYELAYHPGVMLRILHLILSGAGIWLFSWIIVKQPYKTWIQHRLVYRSFRILVVVFLAMLVLAVISNLAGTFRLAEFLALVPLRITIAGIAIQLATKMAGTLVYTLLASNYLQKLNVIKDDFQLLYRKISWLIHFILLLVFISIALDIFRVKEVFYEWGRGVLSNGMKIGAIEITPGSIAIFIFVIWLSVIISRMISQVLEKDVFTRVKAAKGVPSTITLMLKIVLISGGFFLAAAASGMKLTNLSIVLGAFSVGIGFGLQNIFNNMVSGLILAFERPIKVGDIVQVGELLGTVRSIGLRSSTVKSFDGAEVIVPNGNLISNEMVNWTLSDSFRRMDLRVGVKYGTDPDRVLGIMEKIANEHEGVMSKPSPKAYFIEFGDSSLNFRLLAWAHLDNRLEVESEINVLINKKLAEAGIEIPFPQRDLHIRSDATRPTPFSGKSGN